MFALSFERGGCGSSVIDNLSLGRQYRPRLPQNVSILDNHSTLDLALISD